MTYSETLLEIIHRHDSFVLTTHVNPDGDAIGSVLALQRIIAALKKSVRIIIYSEVPHYLRFLDCENVIEKYSSGTHDPVIRSAQVFIGLDFNRFDRLVKMADVIKSCLCLKVCIDHHQDPERAFDHYLTDTEWCATGHFIYRFIKETGVTPLTYALAEPLYAAIMTDTGSFRFERTSPEVHRIAAHLLEAGVKPIEIHQKIYDQNHAGKLNLLGSVLSSITFADEKKQIGIMELSQAQLREADTHEDDTEGFINMMMSITSIRLGLKFLELPNGFKVSLRSKADLPVHLFAGQFGGGGHRNAAGIRFRDSSLSEMKPVVISSAIQFLKDFDNGKII
jgi:phosphoesterase RecJ-like protein